MIENKQEVTEKKRTKDQLVPYQWFWTDQFGQKMSLKSWFLSRKFSIIYLAFIWGIVSVLGLASTRNCDGTWQLSFACEQAIWMIKMHTEPLVFIKSWFTAPFFHNGMDHILFVTIFGFMLPVQSFEVQHGTKATFIIFFVTYIFIGMFNGWLFNFGLAHWPENEFFAFGFERNWMGGSVGFYGIIGAMSYASKKKWFLIFLAACFEVINLTVIGIDSHISFIHMTSCIIGFVTCWALAKYGKITL